jgi:transposase
VQDKRSVVRSVNAGRLSVKEAAVAYRISEDSVRRWIRENKLENEELSSSNQEQLSKKSTKEQAGAGQDRARQLEQQLAEAQLKIAALNTLIDVAEEQLKINIRKKPGARQS